MKSNGKKKKNDVRINIAKKAGEKVPCASF